jgi:predicted phosphodiesterase
MTRIAVLSDIHGNLPALEAIIADLRQFKIDHVIVAGDFINVGPFSTQVTERIADLRWAIIRGNHEFYMLNHGTPQEPPEHRNYRLPPWLNETIPLAWRQYIAALPDELTLCFQDAPPLRVIHGIPNNPWDGIFPNESDAEIAPLLANIREEYLIAAHTHLPMDRIVPGEAREWRVLNAGSAGLPLDGNAATACYMMLKGDSGGWRPTFRRIDYDIAPLMVEMERLDYAGLFGAEGVMFMEEFRLARPHILPFHAWRQQHHPDAPISVELAAAFLRDPAHLFEHLHPSYRLNLEDSY